MVHLFKLGQLSPQKKTVGGSRTEVSKKEFPPLQGVSFYKLQLVPKGIREPHWHANADELGYCLQGKALITLYDTGNVKATFLVKEGDVFLIPTGALHGIENVGDKACELLLFFSNEAVEDFSLTATLGMFSNAVLGNTWGVEESVFNSLKRSPQGVFASLRKGPLVVPENSHYLSPFHYDLEGSHPLIETLGGTARVARNNVWPILKNQAIYSLKLTGEGMREPHWHPQTGELGFVISGKGRMSILSPTGTVDTYIMEPGDIYFIPKAYPHHIENLQNEELHLAIFFDEAMPGDIGFTASVRAFSDETLASITNTNPEFFSQLHKYYEDLFIVEKINPVDPL